MFFFYTPPLSLEVIQVKCKIFQKMNFYSKISDSILLYLLLMGFIFICLQFRKKKRIISQTIALEMKKSYKSFGLFSFEETCKFVTLHDFYGFLTHLRKRLVDSVIITIIHVFIIHVIYIKINMYMKYK